MFKRFKFVTIGLVILVGSNAQAKTIKGFVDNVTSGTEFVLRHNNKVTKVKLKYLVSYDNNSKKNKIQTDYLYRLLADKKITVWYSNTDKNKVKTGVVSTPTSYVNLQMVRDGYAEYEKEVLDKTTNQISTLFKQANNSSVKEGLGFYDNSIDFSGIASFFNESQIKIQKTIKNISHTADTEIENSLTTILRRPHKLKKDNSRYFNGVRLGE